MSRIKLIAALSLAAATVVGIAAAPIGGNSGGYIGTIIPSSAAVTNFLCGTGVLNSAQVCTSSAVLPNGVTAITQTTGDNSTKVATDAFVIANAGSSSIPSIPTTAPVTGTGSAGGVQAATSSLVLPTGTTATTQTTGDNSTKVATDAFVLANAGSASIPSVPTTTPLTGTGAVGGAQAATGTLVLPNGTTATTQTSGDNSTKIATTAFVLANGGSGGLGCASGSSLTSCTSTATGSTTARGLGARAADLFNPKDYGAVGNGSGHSVNSTLGITTLSGLVSAGYTWATSSWAGLTFSLATNTAQGSTGTTLQYTLPTTSNISTPVAASYNYAQEGDVVLPGMTVTGSCIAGSTTVSSVANAQPFSINTPYASASGQNKIRLPFVGGLSVGQTVYNSSGTSLGTITAINSTTYTNSFLNAGQGTMVGTDTAASTGYYSVTGGSATATVIGGTTPTAPTGTSYQVAASTINNSGSGQNNQFIFPAGTLITNVSGTAVTFSKPANFTNANYMVINAVSPPSITISANLGSGITAGSYVYFGQLSQVTLSQATSSPCGANTSITYAFSTGSSGAGTVGGLDMDYLGIQSAVAGAMAVNGQVQVPAGTYYASPHIVIANPTTPVGGGGHISFNGAGRNETVFKTAYDETRGACLIVESDRASGNPAAADFQDFALSGPGGGLTIGAETALMNGLCLGNGENLDNISSESFHSGVGVGGNHQRISRYTSGYDWYGFEAEANFSTSGAQFLGHLILIADNFAGLGVAWNFGLDFSTFNIIHYGFAPYGFYHQGASYGGSACSGTWISNSHLDFVSAEAIGNGTFYGENGQCDKVLNNTFEQVNGGINPDRNYTMPTASFNAVMTAGYVVDNTFINSNFDYSGGSTEDSFSVVSCAIFCGAPAGATTANGSQFSSNNFLDDTSSTSITTLPGTAYNSTYLPPAIALQYTSGNRWNTGYSQGQWFGPPYCSALSAGEVMTFGGGSLNQGTNPMGSSSAPVLGVLTHPNPGLSGWPNCGLVAVTESGLANVLYTNTSGSVASARVSSATPTEVTTAGAGDTTTNQVGVFMGSSGSGLAQIVVRPAPLIVLTEVFALR